MLICYVILNGLVYVVSDTLWHNNIFYLKKMTCVNPLEASTNDFNSAQNKHDLGIAKLAAISLHYLFVTLVSQYHHKTKEAKIAGICPDIWNTFLEREKIHLILFLAESSLYDQTLK